MLAGLVNHLACTAGAVNTPRSDRTTSPSGGESKIDPHAIHVDAVGLPQLEPHAQEGRAILHEFPAGPEFICGYG